MDAIRPVAGGVELRVKVQPRSRRPGLGGPAPDGVLRVAVTEAPEDGRANEAVRRALAEALSVPASGIALAHGATARLKTFRIAGDPARLTDTLQRLLA